MADNLDTQLAQSRDRITEILTNKRPSLQDVSSSFLNAVTGRTSYGEELNAMRAARLGEQKTLFDVLSGHKQLKQADRKLGQAEQTQAWKRIQDARKNGVEDAEAIGKSIERYVVNDADRQIVANHLQSLPETVTALNAESMVSRAVGDLTSQGKIKQKKVSTETGTYSFGNFLESGSNEAVTARRHGKSGQVEINDGTGWKTAGKGSFIGQNVQAGSVGGLTANKVDDIKADLASAGRARSRVQQMLQSVREDKSRAGITGTLRRWGQTAFGITSDLADLGVDVGGIIGDTVLDLKEDLNADQAEAEMASFFDKSLPQNTVFENSLAYQLARARKGDKRINMEDFRIAKSDVNLTGLTSSDDVIARLQAIDMEFAEAERDLQARIGIEPEKEPVWEIRDGKLIQVK
jgi:hypothetical protein